MPLSAALQRALEKLASIAAAYPETREDHPWGHRVFKVRNKAFVFFGGEDGVLSVTVKLPDSGGRAIAESYAEPAGYGLGRAGWVTARFGKGTGHSAAPVDTLRGWIDESFRTVAPVRVVKAMGGEKPAKKKAAPRPASLRALR